MFDKKNNKPFLIAEISSNHNGKINNAKKLIDLAKISGANAVKLQTFTPEKMSLKIKSDLFKIKRVIGKIIIYMNYIKKLKHH